MTDVKLLQLLRRVEEALDQPRSRVSEVAHALRLTGHVKLAEAADSHHGELEQLRRNLFDFADRVRAELSLRARPLIPEGVPAAWFIRLPIPEAKAVGSSKQSAWSYPILARLNCESEGTAEAKELLLLLLVNGLILEHAATMLAAGGQAWLQSEDPVVVLDDGLVRVTVDVRYELDILVLCACLNPGVSVVRSPGSGGEIAPVWDGQGVPPGVRSRVVLVGDRAPSATVVAHVAVGGHRHLCVVFDAGAGGGATGGNGEPARWALLSGLRIVSGEALRALAGGAPLRAVARVVGVVDDGGEVIRVHIGFGMDGEATIPMGREEFARLVEATGPLRIGDAVDIDEHWDGEVLGVKRVVAARTR